MDGDLIARLEAAMGPSHDLDLAIFRHIKPEYAGDEWQPYGGGLRHKYDSSDARCLPPAAATPGRYTFSIDAALTLVPDGWAVRGLTIWPGHPAYLDLWQTHEDRGERWHGRGDQKIRAEAATPALALCIAALRARQP